MAKSLVWRDLLAEAKERLGCAGIAEATSEARWVVEEVSGLAGSDLVSGLNQPVAHRLVARFDEMLTRRETGEPLQYVLGSWAFRQLDLMVDSRALIPRLETEQVVEAALVEAHRLAEALRLAKSSEFAEDLVVVDLGTGTGAIGLSMALEGPPSTVWLTDYSNEVLNLARANLGGIGMAGANVRVSEGSWFEALPDELLGQVDLVVSNPPYIADGEVLPEAVKAWEPLSALFAGPRGTEAVEKLITEASVWLSPHGVLVMEMAPHQVEPMAVEARKVFTEVEIVEDLAGRQRALVAHR